MKSLDAAPARGFVRNAQKDLLQHSLAVWPRREHQLLEVNCGDGVFLPLLWNCGFDVTATERAPELRAAACARLGPRVEVLAAAADHLPFENDAFHWCVLHLDAAALADTAPMLAEALRVTARGLAVTFWNAASPAYAVHRLTGRKQPWPGTARCWWALWRQMRRLAAGRLHGGSALVLPRGFWRGGCCEAVQRGSGPRWLPLGAWGVIRLDLAPPGRVTPLPLRLKPGRLPRPEPVMEYGPRTSLPSNPRTRTP